MSSDFVHWKIFFILKKPSKDALKILNYVRTSQKT